MTPRLARILARGVQRPMLRYWRHLPSLRWLAETEARLVRPLPRDVKAERRCIPAPGGAVRCLVLTPPEAVPGRRLLYVHGGGFVLGSSLTHRALALGIGRAAGAQVVLPDYRLAPEYPYPAALEDLRAVWTALRTLGSTPPTLAGDSAGGALALCLAQRLRAEGQAGPPALALLSPVADLSLSARDLVDRAEADLLIPPDWGARCVAAYLGGTAGTDPGASPLHGPLAGLPPVLIHAACGEVLEGDARRLVEGLRAAGGKAELRLWTGLPHVWQIHAGRLPEADASLAALGAFLARAAARAETPGDGAEAP